MTAPSTSSRPASADACPCGSGAAFGACCEPLLRGDQPAADAEKLMRSRYCAHAVHDFRYLHRTYAPTAATPYVEEDIPPADLRWTKLEIHRHEPEVRPGVAHVEFTAHFIDSGRVGVHHEKSEFLFTDGRWLFNRPLREGPPPAVSAPRVGRNDPCPCGSGKKFKKCCGA